MPDMIEENLVHRCGVVERASLGSRKWGINKLKLSVAHPIVTAGKQAELIGAASSAISSVCDMQINQVSSLEQQNANIILSSGRGRRAGFDGSGGTLAYAYLPPNSDYKGQLGLYFDIDEDWDFTIAKSYTRSRKIYYLIVFLHELGHNLGLDHDGVHSNQLMNAIYNSDVPTWQKYDIIRLVKLYGLPKDIPGEVDPDLPPTDANYLTAKQIDALIEKRFYEFLPKVKLYLED